MKRQAPRHIRRPGSKERGFTLVEIMVALVIFAIGGLTLLALLPLGTKRISAAGEHTRASELATQVVERLLDTPYADADLTAGTHNDTGNPYPGSYFVSWVIVDNAPMTDCKRITVTVRWPTATSTNTARMVAVSPESSWN